MRVETNERLAHRNRQIAQYLFFGTFAVFALSIFFLSQQAVNVTEDSLLLVGLLQPAVVVIAFVMTMISVRMTNLWVRLPRPEVVIREGLKGISNKSVLYSYYHFPARHVLISPQGVFAIVTRFQEGRYTVEGDRWTTHRSPISRVFSALRFEGIGNPTTDALRAAEHIKNLLAPIAPDIEVRPVIVFVSPKAEVTTIDPTVAVVYPGGKQSPILKDLLRDVGKDNRVTLTTEQIQAFEEATLRR